MAEPAAPPAKGGSFLTRKVGPLPTWGYIVGAGGILVFVWWRSRSNANAAAADPNAATPGASTAGDSSSVPTTDYGQGFDYGYAAGMNATGQQTDTEGSTDATGGTIPSAHAGRIRFKALDPAGQVRTVTDFGHWVRRNGRWHWQQGAPPNPGGATGQGHRVPPPNRIRLRHGASQPLAMTGQAVPYATV